MICFSSISLIALRVVLVSGDARRRVLPDIVSSRTVLTLGRGNLIVLLSIA
jgi:hypothetical protein